MRRCGGALVAWRVQPMDVEKLWEILYKERSSPLLQELPQNFYEEVRNYIRNLEQERESANDTRKAFIEDEIRSAKAKIEDIFRRRIGKIVKVASSGAETPPKGLTPAERAIFEGVASCIEEGRKRIMRAIFGEEREEKEDESNPHAAARAVVAAEAVGVSVKSLPERTSEAKVGRQIGTAAEAAGEVAATNAPADFYVVRMLESVPAFIGIDGKVYKVRREDVLTLPKDNAEILCKKGVAVQIKVKRRW